MTEKASEKIAETTETNKDDVNGNANETKKSADNKSVDGKNKTSDSSQSRNYNVHKFTENRTNCT